MPRIAALYAEFYGWLHEENAGNDAACLSRLDQVATLADGFEPVADDEYEIGYCYARHHADLQRAACLLTLDRPRDAITQYHDIRPNWGLVCHWEQGMHTAKLALAHARCGELDRLREWADVPAIAELTQLAATR